MVGYGMQMDCFEFILLRTLSLNQIPLNGKFQELSIEE